MLDVLLTIVYLIITLMVVVVVHEGGHFLAARSCKVRVMEFMAGLPGPSIGVTRGETRFGITAVPLGGYCRIAGMEAGEENPHLLDALNCLYLSGRLTLSQVQELSDKVGYDLEEALDVLVEWGSCLRRKSRDKQIRFEYLAPQRDGYLEGEARRLDDPQAFLDEERSHTYRSLPCWKRLLILVAGPGANVIFAVLVVMAILMTVGIYQVTLNVSEVSEGMPAQAAGVEPGSRITGIAGHDVSDFMSFSSELSLLEAGDEVELTWIDPQGQDHSAMLVLEEGTEGIPVIGVSFPYEYVRPGLWGAFKEAWSYVDVTVRFILRLFNPGYTKQVLDNSTSIVGIAQVTKEAADTGFLNYLYLLAIISISIGLMNLLPIPPLDGGRILVELYQRATRRLVSPKVMNYLTIIGIVLVLLLFIYVTNNDIHNLFQK